MLFKPKLWKRKWQPTPVFLPGESHGKRSLAGCSPRDCNELDMTKRLMLSLSLSGWLLMLWPGEDFEFSVWSWHKQRSRVHITGLLQGGCALLLLCLLTSLIFNLGQNCQSLAWQCNGVKKKLGFCHSTWGSQVCWVYVNTSYVWILDRSIFSCSCDLEGYASLTGP